MPTPCAHPAESQQHLFSARDYISGDRFAIERCRDCGLAFTRPRPAIDEWPRYYPSEYYGGEGAGRFPAAVESLQRALYRRRAIVVEHMLGRKGSVLDIGCGPGFLLREFRERGWEVQGTEFSEQSAAPARNVLGLSVSVGDVRDLKFETARFDAVVMWHVLEHTSEPEQTLAEVARLLRPGGIFLCAVPNFGSWEARLARDKWFHLDVPRHLSHLSAGTLRTLLAARGLAVERTSFISPEYDCFSFTQSSLNLFGLRHNLLYNLLRGSRAKLLRPAAAWQKAASLLLAGPIGLLSVPATVLAALFCRGATVTCYARNRL